MHVLRVETLLCMQNRNTDKHIYKAYGKKPALVSLAMRIASSSVLNRKSGATGPNTSSLRQEKKNACQLTDSILA